MLSRVIVELPDARAAVRLYCAACMPDKDNPCRSSGCPLWSCRDGHSSQVDTARAIGRFLPGITPLERGSPFLPFLEAGVNRPDFWVRVRPRFAKAKAAP